MQSEFNPLLAITGLAFLFAALVVIFFFYRDRYEREPSLKIVKMFIWGCFSTIPALIVNTAALLFFAILFPITNDPDLVVAQMFLAVLVAPITEETFKGIPVLRMQRDPEMDGMMDGLVYGAVCAAGFAFIENILYGLNVISEIYALYGTVILAPALILTAFRSVMMPAGHSLYTGWFGSEVGKEKTPYGGSPLKGFVIAVILHTFWNGMATALSIISIVIEIFAIFSWVFILGTLAVYYILLWWRMNTALALEKPKRA